MEDETLQDALDYCLTNPDELELEELLAKFPESREELVPLLALCGLISEAVPAVPQERKEAIKDRLLNAAMARQQAMLAPSNGHLEGAVAATLPVVTVEPEPTAKPAQPVRLPGKVRVEEDRPRRGFILDWLKRPAFAAAAFAALMLAFIWGLSASALPDSPFYTVKLLGETIAVNVQTSPEGRVLKHNELANIRLREIQEMERRGKLAQAGRAFIDYAGHLRAGRDILNGTQFNDQQKSKLAQALFATTTTGETELAELNDDLSSLPPAVRETVSQAQETQDEVHDYSEDVLQDLGVTPQTPVPTQTENRPQTPGPNETALSRRATVSPTSLGSGAGGRATATSRAVERTATYIANNPASTATRTVTQTRTAVSTATQTTVPAATATHTAATQPSATPTTRIEASPLASTPTPTTKPKNGATVTPPRGQPTETRRPESTRTPGRPPTHTPGPEKTKTKEKGDDSTATAIPTSTYPPSHTPVPPSDTPVPTSTLVPTETPTERPDGRPPTHTPKPKDFATGTVEPTSEPTEEPTEPSRPVSVCAVDVREVSVGCGSGGCIEWNAVLQNKASEPVEINWVAEMQVEVAGAAPMTYRDSGMALVQPGEESISDRFCESIPPSAKKIRVIVQTDTGAENCDSRKSDSIEPCEDGEAPESGPTATQPESTATQSAGPPTQEPVVPTHVTLPTQVSLPTQVVIPTREPEPTKTPRPR